MARGFILALFVELSFSAPLQGTDFPHRSDGAVVKNEPCYVHDSACEGYPVCCVTAGTCISQHSGTISSNAVYYEGGCHSLATRKTEWTGDQENCTQQGECMVNFLAVCKGGWTKTGYMTEVSKEFADREMENSCDTPCPNNYYGHGSYGSDDGTTTTTTTTTFIVSGHMTFTAESGFTWNDDTEALATWTVAGMAGSEISIDHVTSVKTASEGEKQTVSWEITLDSSMSTNATDLETAVGSVKGEKLIEMLSMTYGTCHSLSDAGMGIGVAGIGSSSSTGIGSSSSFSTSFAIGPAVVFTLLWPWL